MVRGGSRGKPKQSLRDLSREHATSEEVTAVSKAILSASSPIVAAILGATIVEQEMEVLLRKQLKRNDKETWERLTGEAGPLSSFWQKTELGYALKLLDDVVRDHINTIRHIRNAFAHSKKLLDFDHPLILKELRTITPPSKRSKRYKDFRVVADLVGDSNPQPQQAYVELCMFAAIELMRRDTKSIKASVRQLQRKIDKITRPYRPGLDFLGSGLMSGADPKFQGGLGLGLLSYQTFDPKHPTPAPNFETLLGLSKGADDNKDK